MIFLFRNELDSCKLQAWPLDSQYTATPHSRPTSWREEINIDKTLWGHMNKKETKTYIDIII